MSEEHFFEQQTASSLIKASIVSSYFPDYCRIITRKHRPTCLRYIDLFAGPGLYDDGKPSTPLLVAKECYKDPFLRNNVWMLFNDNQYCDKLKSNFLAEYPVGTFSHEPFFADRTVGESESVTSFLTKPTMKNGFNETPSLLFFDPFGYKGMETTILAEFLKNWGNEIFLFFNSKRINAALENDKFEDNMRSLFPKTFDEIHIERAMKFTVPERLRLIIDKLGQEYEHILKGKVYYTAFKFQEEDIETTSHFIVHLSKSSKGYELIKTIYNDFANVGTVFDGVNTYTFDAKKQKDSLAEELFDMDSINIDSLKNQIFNQYRFKFINTRVLFDEHQKDTEYSAYHYTQALRRLVEEGKAKTHFTDNIQHRVSVLISNNCFVKFE